MRDPSPTCAPLIPKLRGHFAEFLNDGSLERLRILSSPTCVGFSTDSLDLKHLEAFLEGSADHFGSYVLVVTPGLPFADFPTNHPQA
jgi:hypothetical protein